MALEEQLRFNIRPNQSSFRGDTICSVKKLAMTLYYLKDQGSLRMMSNAYGVAESRKHYGRTVIDRRKVCKTMEIWRKVCQNRNLEEGFGKMFLTIKLETIILEETVICNVQQQDMSNDLPQNSFLALITAISIIFNMCINTLDIFSITTCCMCNTILFLKEVS